MTQPVAGAKKEGAAGFLKGVGKGIGGIVLKPGAGELPSVVHERVNNYLSQGFGRFLVIHLKAYIRSCKNTWVLIHETIL